MGNRILKESIRTSNEIDALSWFEEALFYRLIVTVDDYGVYPADPILLGHMLFPKKESIPRKSVEQALEHLESLSLITRYRVEGKGTYLCLVTWGQHQRLRKTAALFVTAGQVVNNTFAHLSNANHLAYFIDVFFPFFQVSLNAFDVIDKV